MTALRGVGPEKVCEAGSSRSYASVSTIRPPTPSTVTTAPISHCATSSDDAEKSMEPAMEPAVEPSMERGSEVTGWVSSKPIDGANAIMVRNGRALLVLDQARNPWHRAAYPP